MRSADRATGVWLAVLTGLGALVRLPGLGGDLWIDEIASLQDFIQLPLAEIVSTYTANNHVLYSVLAHLSIGAFGETSWALRLPAYLFGIALVPALWLLADQLMPRRETMAVAALAAVSYHHVYFSQSARGYTGYLTLTVLSTALLLRGLGGRRRAWAGFVVAAAANVYLHLNGLFVLAALTLAGSVSLLSRTPGEARTVMIRKFAAAIGVTSVVVLLLYAPLIGPMLEFFGTANPEIGWTFSIDLLRVAVRDVSGGSLVLGLAMLGALPVVVLGLASLSRREPVVPIVMFLPLLLGLFSVVVLGAGTYPRFFLLWLPFAMLCGVRGLGALCEWASSRRSGDPKPGRRLFVAGLSVALLAASAGLPRLWRLPKQDYTSALAFIEERRASGEVVAAAYIADTGCMYYDPSVRSARTKEQLEALLGRGETVWLIGTFLSDMRLRAPGLADLIDRKFVEVERFAGLVGDGAVVVWRSASRAE